MDIVIRGMRNVLRNPLRLLFVVLLLGASLMLVAAMVSLNNSAQQQLANVHKEVGTTITIPTRSTIVRAHQVHRTHKLAFRDNPAMVGKASLSRIALLLYPTVRLRR